PSALSLASSRSDDLTPLVEDRRDPTTGLLTPVGSPIPLPSFITNATLVGNAMIAFTTNGQTGFVANSATNNPDAAIKPQAVVTILNVDASGNVTTSTAPTF